MNADNADPKIDFVLICGICANLRRKFTYD